MDKSSILPIHRPQGINHEPSNMGSIRLHSQTVSIESRTVIIKPQAITNKKNIDKAELLANFMEKRPLILGCIFDAISMGLRNFTSMVRPENGWQRGGEQWIAACFPAFGWKHEDWSVPFYECNRDANLASLDKDTGSSIFLSWFAEQKQHPWIGSADELLQELNLFVKSNSDFHKLQYLPQTPGSMVDKLQEIKPSLLSIGIEATSGKKSKYKGKSIRRWTITQLAEVNEDEKGCRDSTATARQPTTATTQEPVNIDVLQKGCRGCRDFSTSLEKEKENDVNTVNTVNEEKEEFTQNHGNHGNHGKLLCEIPIKPANDTVAVVGCHTVAVVAVNQCNPAQTTKPTSESPSSVFVRNINFFVQSSRRYDSSRQQTFWNWHK